ncbi:glucose-6-phosphate isomerase [Pseudohongiella sp.]|uniref:glucose-6-phosphate isomerase n=1 Tax=marine sediment metagenome TaxID=412755 RepID=A0A0F9YIX8_9ZZZZ|nr:glucose-6-phosphate isomerase [Pseudohongiella sp.]HDZ09393.1 glucose-6-phosphate isomerase [Pseudohongiella sp.]HEA63758.1 glucose-6-phosphate isomerase [Pseudohongiella sp.]
MARAHETEVWRQLQTHQAKLVASGTRITGLFAQDPQRCASLSFDCGNIRADFSKHLVTTQTLASLIQLADTLNLPRAIDELFSGAPLNNTEQRPALHMALRGLDVPARPDIKNDVDAALAQMESLVSAVHTGTWQGYAGDTVRDVVNIGIGGSDLGPAMATCALRAQHQGSVRCHFVSNVDPAHLHRCLALLRPETTLFVVASKSFTTLETMQNARQARQWFIAAAHNPQQAEAELHRHFVAVTANKTAAVEFGIRDSQIFPMWDWVGGRFSLWSAIGLPIALAVGMAQFRRFLAGAALVDQHFASAPLAANVPVLMGLLAVWYRNFWGAGSHAVLPYAQDLELLPCFLQQLEMESLGKSVDRGGRDLEFSAGPVIWGSAGTNGQHSFHQLLHQGTEFVPADFIAVARPTVSGNAKQHQHLLANCFSQSRALMEGKSRQQAQDEMLAADMDPSLAGTLAAHKAAPGNRPSTTLLLTELSAFNLGSLIALYEHKVFVQSVIWNINAFDQWGVEIGKQLSTPAFAALSGDQATTRGLDPSSQALISHCLQQAGSTS